MRLPRFVTLSCLLGLCLIAGPIPGQALTTTFLGGNGGQDGWGALFDVQVKAPGGVLVWMLEVHCREANKALDLDVYITPDSYKGADDRPERWVRVGGGRTVARGLGSPTPVDVDDFYLAPGRYGVAVYHRGAGVVYSNGNGMNQRYANGDLVLDLGVAKSGLFAGGTFTPRVWNGTIYYVKHNIAAFTPLGWGCRGTGGVPTLRGAAANPPRLGRTLGLELDRLRSAGGVGVMQLGFSRTGYPGFALPADLGFVGMPGCVLWGRLDLGIPLVHAGARHRLDWPVPLYPPLLGRIFYCQAILHDPGANAAGFVVTNLGMGRVGL